VPVKVNE
jgi:hypothetical protein